jgi:hypothetical protein
VGGLEFGHSLRKEKLAGKEIATTRGIVCPFVRYLNITSFIPVASFHLLLTGNNKIVCRVARIGILGGLNMGTW